MTVFNLDLDNKIQPSMYVYKIPTSTKTIYFRIIDNDYPIDYKKFNNINVVINNKYSTYSYDLATVNGETLIKYDIESDIINSSEMLIMKFVVNIENRNIRINKELKIALYDNTESSCRDKEWGLFKNLMDNFNITLGRYYNSIKRDQIDTPNGIISLDDEGKINQNLIPDEFLHPNHLIIQTRNKEFIEDGKDIGLHGLKMDEKWRLTYYDEMDEEWYVVNSVFGGSLYLPHKPSEWNIFGGDLLDNDSIDARLFTKPLEDFIDGGEFDDGSDTTVDANFNDGGYVRPDDILSGGSIL